MPHSAPSSSRRAPACVGPVARALLAVLIAAAVGASTHAGAERTGQTGRDPQPVYVSVLDSTGKPVMDLTAEDFVVREDGVQREVLSAGPATAPMHISVLVDDSEAARPAIQMIREGLTTFVKQLQDKAEIAIATFGERPTPIVEYTSSTEQLIKGINRIFARPDSGAYLLEALVEVSRGLQKRETQRPVIVVLTVEGVEFSNLHYENVLEQLAASGAQLHVLAVGPPSSSLSDEMRNRNLVLAEGTARSGGRRDQILAISAIPAKFEQLAVELGNQYIVRYSRPDTLIPPEEINVSVKRPGLTVRAATRVRSTR